jgi:hypothetical protein
LLFKERTRRKLYQHSYKTNFLRNFILLIYLVDASSLHDCLEICQELENIDGMAVDAKIKQKYNYFPGF